MSHPPNQPERPPVFEISPTKTVKGLSLFVPHCPWARRFYEKAAGTACINITPGDFDRITLGIVPAAVANLRWVSLP